MEAINLPEKKNVSLVLSSGGARGIAHIGVIRELERLGYNIVSVSGTSIGSVIGSFYAAGFLDKYEEWVLNLDVLDVIRLFDVSISSQGFIKGQKVFKELKKIIPDQNIEDFKIPFSAIAADVKNHKEVVFSSGSLYDAIRASVSIPSILTPFKWNKVSLIDGGVLNPLPLNHVQHSEENLLVAVDLNANIAYKSPYRKIKTKKEADRHYRKMLDMIVQKYESIFPEHNGEKKIGYFQLVTESVEIMQERIIELSLQINKPDVLVSLSRNACSTFEFHRAQEMIDYGKRELRKELKKLAK